MATESISMRAKTSLRMGRRTILSPDISRTRGTTRRNSSSHRGLRLITTNQVSTRVMARYIVIAHTITASKKVARVFPMALSSIHLCISPKASLSDPLKNRTSSNSSSIRLPTSRLRSLPPHHTTRLCLQSLERPLSPARSVMSSHLTTSSGTIECSSTMRKRRDSRCTGLRSACAACCARLPSPGN